MVQKKLAIVKLSALGDVVQALHGLSTVPLKKNFSEITWVCERASAPLVRLCPYVDKVIALDLKKWKRLSFWIKGDRPFQEVAAGWKSLRMGSFSHVLDLQGNLKSALIAKSLSSGDRLGLPKEIVREKPASFFYDRNADISSLKLSDMRTVLAQTAQVLCDAEKNHTVSGVNIDFDRIALSEREHLGRLIPQKPYLVVSAFSAWPSKEPSFDMIKMFIRGYLQHNSRAKVLILWGGDRERERAKEMLQRLIKQPDIDEKSLELLPELLRLDHLSYLIAKAHCVMGCDSLVHHLAAWVDVPRFAFFGPTQAKYYGLTSSKKTQSSWQGTCPYGLRFENRCPQMRRCSAAPCMQHAPLTEIEKKLDAFFQQL